MRVAFKKEDEILQDIISENQIQIRYEEWNHQM